MTRARNTWLQALELENFRCFGDFAVEFGQDLTVLVAENGQGKTAVLDAVATSLQLFADELGGQSGAHVLSRSDIRLVRSPEAKMVPVLPMGLGALGYFDGREVTWGRRLERLAKKIKATTRDAAPLTQAAQRLRYHMQDYATRRNPVPPLLPVIGYYGTGRLWSQHKLTDSKRIRSKGGVSLQTDAYVDCLSPSSSFRAFKNWYEGVSREAQKVRDGGTSPHFPDLMLQAVNNAVDTVLEPSGWHGLTWDFVNDEIAATHADRGELAVDKLSDGIRNIIGIVADLAHRAVRLNPYLHERACLQSPGIVLIDEVDMHLHPAWQQTVIASLTSAFPRIQFIVTTHSPQVLSTVDRQSIRILHADGTVSLPRAQTRGVGSADVLATAMGVDPIPDVPEWARLRQYRAVIERGAWQEQEAIAMRAELEAHFGADHPLMLDCDRLIRFQSFRLRRSPAGSESP
jgi:predicted ATP-binding protein involved in virulence